MPSNKTGQSELSVGLVGCGRIARAVHLPVLLRLRGVQVTAVAEPDGDNRAHALRAAPHARGFGGFEEMFAAAELDAVVICAPPALHAPCAVAAFDAGCHVYVEKPLAPAALEAQHVVDAWTRAGTVGMMGFNFRFHPQVSEMRARLDRGEAGTPIAIRSTFSIVPDELPHWKQARASGGGVMLDLASHHVDMIHFLMREPVVRVAASSRSLLAEQDNAVLQLELASGVMAQLFVSLGATDENHFEIIGTRGKLAMDRTELLHAAFMPATLRGTRFSRLLRTARGLDPRLILRTNAADGSFASALRCFVGAARGEQFSGPDLHDGIRSLAVVEAAERSARLGTTVAVMGHEPGGFQQHKLERN